MKSIMSYKIVFRLVILAFLSVTLWIVYARPVRTQQDGRSIPITITGQPEAVNGIVPIEIKCGPAQFGAPNTLERFNCSLKNNSAQSVSAANVVYSVILDTSAGTTTQAYNRTLDALVHPDFKLSNKLVTPGEQADVGTPGPTSYPDGIIKEVSISLDYVEFEDGTVLGPDHEGSRLIGLTRQGAVKYKEWLREQYKQSGNAVQAIVPLLESSQTLPQEVNLTGREEAGANAYRRDLLKLDKKLGRAELEKRLR